MFKNIIFILTLCTSLHAYNATIKIYVGNEIQHFESLIIKSRQYEFSKFPYLMWQGDEFEQLYASVYTKSNFGALAVAYKDDEIVGFLTGCPLEDFDAALIPFGCATISDQLAPLLNTQKNYYLGDVIVFEPHRGQGIAAQLFQALESYAKSLSFDSTSFITVIRYETHPLKPLNYKSPVSVWTRMNYARSQKTITYEWPTFQYDSSLIIEKNTSDLWIKNIA